MKNNFKYILFDLDGTLTDSGEGITKAVQYALKHFNIIVDDLHELRKFIGPPLRDSYIKYYNLDEKEVEIGMEKFREYYGVTGIYENMLYDGIIDVLDKLKKNNKKIVLATSKPEFYAKEILKHFKIDEYFFIVAGADFEETRVRKGDIIKYALDQIENINSEEIVMIGDREHDIIGAKENNISSIGVLYGFGNASELAEAGADYIVDTPQELLNVLLP